MVLGWNYGNNSTDPAVSSTGSLKESASADHGRIEQLWDQIRIGHLVTVTVHTGIKFVRKIFDLNVTFGLCFSAESNSFEHETIVDFTRGKFHRVKINYHAAVF